LNPKKSESSWEKALEINPSSARAKVLLSQLHFVTGQINILSKDEINEEKSISLIMEAERTDSENYLYSRLLGNIYRARSEFDKSLSAYKKAQTLIADKNSFEYGLLDLLSGHNYLFKKDFDKARELYSQSRNNTEEASFPNVLTGTWTAHTYLYEKKYDEAIQVIDDLETQISSFKGSDPMRKINALATCDWERFLTYGHSQMKEDALESVLNRNVHLDELKEKRSALAGSEEELIRINLDTEIEKDFLKIWYLILFGEFEDAFSELKSYSQLSSEYLVYDSKAMVNFYKLSGYLNLMSGNLDTSISFYNQIPQELLEADNYHLYFYALAIKSKGQKERSSELFKYLANYNFAGWENSIIRSLAEVQLDDV
jgi:tetratricopeptide (TPR) repeat protein